MESSSDDEGGATASDASGDRDMVKKGPKKEVKAKAKDGDDKGKASPTKKGKRPLPPAEKTAREGETACVCAKETKEGR